METQTVIDLDQLVLGAACSLLQKRLRAARLWSKMESFSVFPTLSGSAFVKDVVPAPGYRLNVFARAGANEGHYVHVQAQFDGGGEYPKDVLLFIGKTFHGADVALKVAAVLAKALNAV